MQQNKIHAMRRIPICSEEDRKILHVLIGHSCNNNCIFCFEMDRKGRYTHVMEQKKEDIKRMIFSNKDASEVLFTCGEPTLNQDFPLYVRWAKMSGIKRVRLITNARRFAYRDYAECVVQSGVNSITVSIHGHNDKLHDALTRTKGSFEQTYSGLKNLCELKNKYVLNVKTSTVVNKRNYKHIRDIHTLISSLSVDKIIFNAVTPDGRGMKYFSRVMPRFCDVVEEIKKLVSVIPGEEQSRIVFIDYPYCTTETLPDVMRGHIEKFIQYEPLTMSGHKEIDKENVFNKMKTLETKKKNRMKSDDGAVVDGFYVTSRQFKESFFRVKREECERCEYDTLCPGIWERYVKRFGWDEFVPM